MHRETPESAPEACCLYTNSWGSRLQISTPFVKNKGTERFSKWPMVAPVTYHSLVAKFQSFEQLKKHWGIQGGVAGQGQGDTRTVPLTAQLRRPMEDTRV